MAKSASAFSSNFAPNTDLEGCVGNYTDESS